MGDVCDTCPFTENPLQAMLDSPFRLAIFAVVYSINANYADLFKVTQAMPDDDDMPGIILEHRALTKLVGTYLDALPRQIHPDTGRIHTRFNQAVAATGRPRRPRRTTAASPSGRRTSPSPGTSTGAGRWRRSSRV